MRISLDSILLFCLVIPFIMTYRLSPGQTPFWLFGIIFFSLLSYLFVGFTNVSEKKQFMLKSSLLWFLILIVIGSAFASAIIVRHQTHPVYMVHDIIIQQESAIYFLLHGKNPYATSYFGTPLEQWHYSDTDVNPALYYLVMGPFYLLFAVPFYLISNRTIGFFDGRIPLLFLFLSLLILAFKLVKEKEEKLLFVILLAFNPAMLGYTLEGRSDVFMYAFLFAGFYLLYLKRYTFSSVPFSLAFAIKQSAWPFFPLYIAYLVIKEKNYKKIIKPIVVFGLIFLIITGPFLLWNPKAFIDSTVLYLSGGISHGYPVSGYGLGSLLLSLGVIKNIHDYYPFIVWQVIIGIPVLFYLIKILRKQPSVSMLIFTYGIFLFIFWYLSRYFNNSHLGYLTLVFISAYFFPKYDKDQIEKSRT